MNDYDRMCADETDDGYDVLEYERPEDADQALPSYRLALKGCHQWSYIELQLDAAELDLIQRIAAKFDANTRERCAPTILFDRRVKPGALEFDSNFTGA